MNDWITSQALKSLAVWDNAPPCTSVTVELLIVNPLDGTFILKIPNSFTAPDINPNTNKKKNI
jgi:hypothetical protein